VDVPRSEPAVFVLPSGRGVGDADRGDPELLAASPDLIEKQLEQHRLAATRRR
jgi:hypothetical protein